MIGERETLSHNGRLSERIRLLALDAIVNAIQLLTGPARN